MITSSPCLQFTGVAQLIGREVAMSVGRMDLRKVCEPRLKREVRGDRAREYWRVLYPAMAEAWIAANLRKAFGIQECPTSPSNRPVPRDITESLSSNIILNMLRWTRNDSQDHPTTRCANRFLA